MTENKNFQPKTRSEITARISELLEKQISHNYDPRRYWAREVTFDYGTPQQVRVDYMLFLPHNNSVSGIEKGLVFAYEIKSCVDDFESGHGLNFVGDYNYIVTTPAVWEAKKDYIMSMYGVGVFVLSESGNKLECVRKGSAMNRQHPLSQCLLMMFRSAARDRDARKRKNAGWEK